MLGFRISTEDEATFGDDSRCKPGRCVVEYDEIHRPGRSRRHEERRKREPLLESVTHGWGTPAIEQNAHVDVALPVLARLGVRAEDVGGHERFGSLVLEQRPESTDDVRG